MVNSVNPIAIICNGQPREVDPGTTVASLIRLLQLDPDQVAVELDGRVLSREEVTNTELVAGARLELIRFVGGG